MIYFCDTIRFGGQVYSDATSDENSDCKSCRGQGMEEARDNPSTGFGKSQEQGGGFSESTQRHKESPLRFIDGHLSPQERGVRTKIIKIQRTSRAPGRHCKRRLWSLRSLH